MAWIGKTRDRAIDDLVTRYVARAERLGPVKVRVVTASRAVDPVRKSREDAEALRRAAAGSHTVLLSPRGESWTSEDLAGFLRARLDRGREPTAFLVGGESGFLPADEVWADQRLALSSMTLPHELARLVLAEQIYRGLSIVRGLKYHK